MSQCTQPVVPGGTYFFTVRLQDRTSRLLTQRVDLLRAAMRLAQKQWPFTVDVAVVLPDHLHMIWTMPDTDADFSKRWRMIKSTFSRHIEGPAEVSPSMARRGEKGIWQRRFWEHLIRDDPDFEAHRAFALAAPVQAGLVARPQDWAHSSVHRDLRWGRELPAMSGYGPLVGHCRNPASSASIPQGATAARHRLDHHRQSSCHQQR